MLKKAKYQSNGRLIFLLNNKCKGERIFFMWLYLNHPRYLMWINMRPLHDCEGTKFQMMLTWWRQISIDIARVVWDTFWLKIFSIFWNSEIIVWKSSQNILSNSRYSNLANYENYLKGLEKYENVKKNSINKACLITSYDSASFLYILTGL